MKQEKNEIIHFKVRYKNKFKRVVGIIIYYLTAIHLYLHGHYRQWALN